ncbi:hypothetical protein T492DRAFT_993607 [Pavlovales sp. CCMP2436]|nr:hypothetical protein T492DRAFT_993607 [Pavlovales sp. CCMP2436]
MYDPSLEKRVTELRQLAVDTLEQHVDKPLLMEDDDFILGGELVETVAEQYGLKAPDYLALMRKPRVWGGGPEIIALVTAIGHPIHVYEPVCANNGTEIHLVLSGKYGSPTHDSAGAIHVLAADDKFPHCGPTEFRLHGEGGNHFLALIPSRAVGEHLVQACAPDPQRDEDPDRES